jgi:hypothetical protein
MSVSDADHRIHPADRARARELYEKGTKAYNLQEFSRALELSKLETNRNEPRWSCDSHQLR